MPGEAESCRRGFMATTARLSGGVAEGAKGPLGGWGNLGSEEGGTYPGSTYPGFRPLDQRDVLCLKSVSNSGPRFRIYSGFNLAQRLSTISEYSCSSILPKSTSGSPTGSFAMIRS
jgi:hypothetical protein